MAINDEQYAAELNDAYRALGRFIVKFSQLISRMRWLASWRVALNSSENENYAELFFVEASAGNVSDAFFGLCRLIADYTPEEDEVAGKLQNDVMKVIKYRNRTAHGDWWVGYLSTKGDKIADPAFTVLKRLGKTDRHFAEDEPVPVKKLDERTDQLVELTALVSEFGFLALGFPLGVFETEEDGVLTVKYRPTGTQPSTRYRVSDVLTMTGPQHKRRVVRQGPKAGLLPAWKLQLA